VRAASSISSMSTSLRSGAASPRRLSIGPDTLATLSRPPSRAAIPSRSHTPTRSHTPSGSMGSLPLGFGTVNGSSTPVPPVPARRPARRSSMGVDDGAPPTAIPGPKSRAAAGAGLSASTFGGTPPPPVPRLPSQVRRVSDRADRGHAF
jgi:hypothetical protein